MHMDGIGEVDPHTDMWVNVEDQITGVVHLRGWMRLERNIIGIEEKVDPHTDMSVNIQDQIGGAVDLLRD